MKCTVIAGRNGTGKTGVLLNHLNKNEDNLVVTTDPSVIYIEMYMARNNIPGRCVGINSLYRVIAEDIGIIMPKESSMEIEIAIIGKIINNLSSQLSIFNDANFNNGLINKIHSFLTECKESNISPDDLFSISARVEQSFSLKINDLVSIYKEYNKILKENNFLTKDDLVSLVANSIKENKISYKNVYIDTIDRYNDNTMSLLTALLPACENFYIAFNKTSRKAYDFPIHQESIKALGDFSDAINKIIGIEYEYIETTSPKDISNGLSIIEKELFSKDTATVSDAQNVVLHQASTLYKEVDFLISEINKLIAGGAKYSEIIVSSSSMDRYINIISAALKKNNIPYYYFKNTTIEKTLMFDFVKNVIDVKINGLTAENLLNLCHINFFDLSQEEIVAVDTFINRFGHDLNVAFENGKKYDSNNTLIVESVISKIFTPINEINNAPVNVKQFISELYMYLDKLNIRSIIVEKANKAETEGYIHASKEMVETWNNIMSIFSNIHLIFGNDSLNIKDIGNILVKMASEKISNNSDLYHGQLTLLDIDNAQNRKSKYLFVLGCNEGYMPRPVGVQIVGDREKLAINDILKKNLRLSSIYQNYKIASIYNTLILPDEKLFLSWASYDIDFKPLKVASMLNNVVKTFENNIVKEENYYNNDEEERFINFIKNISLLRYSGKKTEGMNDEFMFFSSHPRYNKRLIAVMEQMKNDNMSFNVSNALSGYKETDYFSVTRLEKFNECPFKHYMEFAIMPERAKLFEETAADKGNYNHLVFKKFFDMCMNGDVDIMNITYDDYIEVLNGIFKEVDSIHNENFLNSSSKNKFISYTMKEKAKSSLWNAMLQLRNSSYNVIANEFVIGKNISLDIDTGNGVVHIIGVVDRVDSFSDYVRIIDYKSGNVEFSVDRMNAGIQMQLPLYSKAMSKEADISGMYFFRIKDYVKDADEDDSPLREYRLSGPTLDNRDILFASDKNLDDGKASDIIQVDITNKGDISKKSKVLSKTEFDDIIENTTSIAVSTINRIKAGETQASPLVLKDFDACKYCQYKSLCNIDRTSKNSIRKS